MTTQKGHPSRDELLVMAYVDDQLAPEAREELEGRLSAEPELRRMVVEYRKLELLARRCAPPEPADHEWRALEDELLRRGGVGLGLGLLLAGGIGLLGWAAYAILRSELDPLAKLCLGALLGGFTLLLVLKLRDRLRLYPYDPYTEVER